MKLYQRFFIALLLMQLLLANVKAQQSANHNFAIRGFHIDLRIQVMRMPALKQMALNLSKNGINTLLMEWEGTYPFQQEPIIANRYAYTRKEIVDFVSYCKDLGITVIPLQQSFGHVEYVLRNQRYTDLREDQKDFSQVCPSKLELNKALFTKLYKDLISTHPSPYIHIGCDETHLLGHCPLCQKRAAQEGISKLYFDHVKMLCDIVISLGKRPVLWADIALKYPEYINQLPKQTILVDWNYGWNFNKFGDHEKLVQSGYEIWGAPALRSDPDNYNLTWWQHHFDNISEFVPRSRQLGYNGMIMTSWSTSGEYDAQFDNAFELKDLYAVRHVYPLSGFNLLIKAYSQAILQQKALNTNTFMMSYCKNQYGLEAQSAILFKKALFSAPYRVIDGKVISSSAITLDQLADSARYSASIFKKLKPTKNQQEFEHYCLMSDIRVYYLTYLQIEAAANAAKQVGDLQQQLIQLKTLIASEDDLNKRFEKLNAFMLYPSTIQEENDIRCYKTHRLYNQLSRQN